ncbi:MAG: gliding motility-associated-like protein [Flavobacteriaceae bacterium]|jgi:gliding motility-associated-like protein
MNFKDKFIKQSKRRNKYSILIASVLVYLFMSTSLYSQTIIDCAAGHANFTYCYTSNDTTQFVFTNTSGLPLNLVFNAGQTEVNFDEVFVFDTDGVTNLNAALPYGNNGNLAGLTFQSSGDTITLMIDSDSVIGCSTGGFIEWDWDVWCQTCLNPTVSYDTDDCQEGEDFSVLVDVQDLGTATTININDDQGSPQQSVTTTGIVSFGPYAPTTIVVITVENADDSNCIISSNGISCLSGIFEIDDSLSTQELVEDVLFNSNCVELSNFSQSTGTDFGDVNGIGAFYANGADFPFQEGLILTSGNVLNAPGPNLTLHSDGGLNWPGDLDLEANTTATQTNNASWVQFDFVPLIDQISFNFLLASEEYNQNFECTYSDAFAFIITDQVTGVVQNLAVLPGTNIPIEVTNIHPDVPGQCSAINEEYFDKYNFTPFNPESEATIDYNGQIVSLQAIGSVIVGNPYTIKLVIADETDTALDSAVFIEAGSFDIGNVDLGDDILISTGNAVCNFETITLDAGDTPGATYQWFKDGVELVGETNSTLVVSEEGLYRIEVAFEQAPDCISSDEILVEFFESPVFDLGDDQSICDGTDITLDATPTNISELSDVSYKWFKDDTELIGETASTLNVTSSGLYKAEVTGNGCLRTDEVTIQLAAFSVDLGDDINLCDISSYEIIPVIEGETAGAIYLWGPGGETTPTITVTQSGIYTLQVTVDGCTTEDNIEVNLGTTPIFDLGGDIETCLINPIILDATPTNTPIQQFNYEWSLNGTILTGETNATLIITGIGTYSAVVNDGSCSSQDSIIITSANDINIDLGQDFETCFEGQVVLDATPSNYDSSLASFEWSLNGTVISGETNATLAVSTIGTYSVLVSVGVCSSNDSVVISAANDILIDLGEDIATCFEDQFLLNAAPSNYDPTEATYEWSLNGTVLTGETGVTLVVSDIGTYSVIVTFNICTTSDSIVISNANDVQIELGDDFLTCFDQDVWLDASPLNYDASDATYQWFLNGELIDFGDFDNPTLLVTIEGSYSVIVTLGICTAEDSINLELPEGLEVSLSPTQLKVCPDDINTLVAISNDSDVEYRWEKDEVIIEGETSASLEISLTENESGPVSYRVRVKKQRCIAYDYASITLFNSGNCFIPQGLSPNNDGFNDYFDLEFISDRTGVANFQVYNRNGVNVYERNNYVKGWGGQTDDNVLLPTGTYFYIITMNGNDPIFGNQVTGWVYINRDFE